MTTSVLFPQAKDPGDVVWYSLVFAGQSLSSTDPVMTVLINGRVSVFPSPGLYLTPGDSAPDSDLVVSNASIVHAASGDSVAFILSGGSPGRTYAITAKVVGVDGSEIVRSGILTVTGL